MHPEKTTRDAAIDRPRVLMRPTSIRSAAWALPVIAGAIAPPQSGHVVTRGVLTQDP